MRATDLVMGRIILQLFADQDLSSIYIAVELARGCNPTDGS